MFDNLFIFTIITELRRFLYALLFLNIEKWLKITLKNTRITMSSLMNMEAHSSLLI